MGVFLKRVICMMYAYSLDHFLLNFLPATTRETTLQPYYVLPHCMWVIQSQMGRKSVDQDMPSMDDILL